MSPPSLDRQQDTSPASSAVIDVWDLPIRVFHWALVALLAAAVISGKIGGDAMEIHLKTGYGIVVLVAFRLLWGFVGSPHARFVNFVRGIPSVFTYCRQLLRGESPIYCGHNPLGGWMVIALLTILAVQTGTGLFANDDIMTEGPLVNLVGKDMSDYLTAIHKLDFKVLAVLAGVHMLAIAYYQAVKRINLVRPMITGRMTIAAEHSHPAKPIPAYTNVLALVLLVFVAAGFYVLVPAA